MVIAPLSVNCQGNDTGIQYRTESYNTDQEQLPRIMEVYEKEQKKYDSSMAVTVEKLMKFYPVEEYHQKYLDKNPSGYCHIPDLLLHLTKTERDCRN